MGQEFKRVQLGARLISISQGLRPQHRRLNGCGWCKASFLTCQVVDTGWYLSWDCQSGFLCTQYTSIWSRPLQRTKPYISNADIWISHCKKNMWAGKSFVVVFYKDIKIGMQSEQPKPLFVGQRMSGTYESEYSIRSLIEFSFIENKRLRNSSSKNRSHVIKKMQIKKHQRYYHSPIRMARI